MDSSNFTNEGNSPTPQVEIHTRQKLCRFRRYVAKAKLFCLRNFRSGYPGWMFIRENFQPAGFREISVQASDVNTSRFLRMEVFWSKGLYQVVFTNFLWKT